MVTPRTLTMIYQLAEAQRIQDEDGEEEEEEEDEKVEKEGEKGVMNKKTRSFALQRGRGPIV